MDETPSGGAPPDREAGRARDAELVVAALAGDRSAFGLLYDAWYDRVWNVARRVVLDPEVAAEVAQDTFLSAWRNLGTLEDPDAFGGWLLRIARNASFNRRRKETRSSPVDDRGLAMIESSGTSPTSAPTGFGVEDRARSVADPERVAGDAELVALVRESASAMGERDAEVLDLQLRYGLSPAEIGEVMGMNRNAANQLCHRVRQRFATAVRARVLWRGDRPACDALDGMLRSAGIAAFDGEAVKLAEKHADACPRCSERRETRLQPSAMFAAVPLVAAPVLLKQQTAHALEAAGVAMDGSSFGSGSEASSSPPHDGGRGRRARRGRAVAMVTVAAFVLVAAIALLASRAHDGTIDQVEVASEPVVTTTAVPSTIAVEPPPSSTPDTLVPETVPPDAVEPPVDSSTTSTTVPLPTIDVTLTPASALPTYLMRSGPLLTWSVFGAGSVRVEGTIQLQPAELSSQAAGSLRVCPGYTGSGPNPSCSTPPGQYTYTVRAFDASGVEVASRTVTLVVG